MTMITTHVLDTSVGQPGVGVSVVLEMRLGAWTQVAAGETDGDGRCAVAEVEQGTYRMTFGVGAYYAKLGLETLYPQVGITFTVAAEEEKYHLPLLLNPFGFTTYRGT